MTRLVIVESNTPDIVASDRKAGRLPAGDGYAAALTSIANIDTAVIAPYAKEDADLDGVDGVVFTGSAVSWDTADSRAKPLATVMEAAFGRGHIGRVIAVNLDVAGGNIFQPRDQAQER